LNEELKRLIEEHNKAIKELREKHEKSQEGKITEAEFKAAQEKLETRLDEIDKRKAEIERQGNEIKAVNTRIDELETRLGQPGISGADAGREKDAAEYRQAFLNWARKGNDGITSEDRQILIERKAMLISDDTLGGYLASPNIENEIIKGITEMSPVRQLARIKTIGKRSTIVRKRTATFAAAWANELQTLTETAGLKYGAETSTPHKLYAWVEVSKEDLEDSDFNLEQEIIQEAQEQFDVAEGTAFISGNTKLQPEGMLVNTDVGETKSGDAATLKGDGLINLAYAIKTGYARNALFLMRRDTVRVIRLLKDGQGNYLWQASYREGQPETLLGRRIIECPDVPAVAADAYPIIFGDIRRAYQIVDRRGLTVERLVELKAATDVVVFKVTKRVDGMVVLAEALQKQKVAA